MKGFPTTALLFLSAAAALFFPAAAIEEVPSALHAHRHDAQDIVQKANALLATQSTTNLQHAIELYEEAASLRAGAPSGAALCALAYIYLEGEPGVLQPNVSRAAALFNESASLGNATAQWMVGVFHAYGIWGFEWSQAKAVLHYYFASLGGEPRAWMALGSRHWTGRNVPKSCSSAAPYYEQAANLTVRSNSLYIAQHPLMKERLSHVELEGLKSDKGADLDAVKYYEDAAEKGDHRAKLTLAHVFYTGAHGVPRDLRKASLLFKQVAEQGDVQGMAMYGHMLGEGVGLPSDPVAALEYLEPAAKHGNLIAETSLGILHLAEPLRDHAKAFGHFKKAWDSGQAHGAYNVGKMQLDGTAPDGRNFKKAYTAFSTGAQAGHLESMYAAGKMQLAGHGTSPSCTSAVEYLLRVSIRGPWQSLYVRAYEHLLQGKEETALVEYLELAEMGYPIAQWNAAWLLDHMWATGGLPVEEPAAVAGEATPEVAETGTPEAEGAEQHQLQSEPSGASSLSRAFHLLQLASQNRDIEARVRLGDYYYYGKGGLAPSVNASLQHYRYAAEAGHSQAAFNLGWAHEMGAGVPKDLHLAKRFYDQASAHASQSATYPVTIALWRLWLKILWCEFRSGLTAVATASTVKAGNAVGNADWQFERGWVRWAGRQVRAGYRYIPWVGPKLLRWLDAAKAVGNAPDAPTSNNDRRSEADASRSSWFSLRFNANRFRLHRDDTMILGLFCVLVATMLLRRHLWRRHRLQLAAQVAREVEES